MEEHIEAVRPRHGDLRYLDIGCEPRAPARHRFEANAAGLVALYNIESSAIDKTIIDMLMATWKMLSEGRDTPLLKVTERAYYHRSLPRTEKSWR
jgi:hypothetical protein